MENITYTTELSELLPLNAIASKILDMQSEVKSHTSTRIDLLTSNQGHGLSSSILVSGEPLFNTKAKEIIKDYGVVEEWIDNYIVSAGIKAAADKRLEELDELYTAVDNEIQRLIKENEEYYTTYTTDDNKISKVTFTDTIKNMIVNIALPGSGVTAWVITSVTKVIYQAQLYDAYLGDAGVITINKKNIAAWEEKLTEIEEEMKKATAIYGGDYTALDGASQTNDTNSDGNQTAAGDGQETDDETEVANPTDATEKQEDKSTTDQSTNYLDDKATENMTTSLTGNDKVTINGEEYKVDGYITTSDGENRAIYIKDTKAYYIDKDGNVQEATKQVGYGVQNYVIDGEEYDKTAYHDAVPNMSSKNETFEISETDKNYVTKASTDDLSDTGGHGAGHEFDVASDYSQSVTVTNSTGQKVQLYSKDGEDSFYYKDKNGDYKKAPSNDAGQYIINDNIYQ